MSFHRSDTLTAPKTQKVQVLESCHRCGGAGGFQGWPGFYCFECRGACKMTYFPKRWVFPQGWTDEACQEFLDGKAAQAAARAEAKRLAKVAAAAEARLAAEAEVPGILAAYDRWAAGEFEARGYEFAASVLSQTHALYPITVEQAQAVVVAVARTDAALAERAAQPHEWIGDVGAKVTFTGKVLFTKWVDSRFGRSLLIVFQHETGTVKTFTTAAALVELAKGDEVTVTGTVKSHDMYEGRKSTMMSRPKLVVK